MLVFSVRVVLGTGPELGFGLGVVLENEAARFI